MPSALVLLLAVLLEELDLLGLFWISSKDIGAVRHWGVLKLEECFLVGPASCVAGLTVVVGRAGYGVVLSACSAVELLVEAVYLRIGLEVLGVERDLK